MEHKDTGPEPARLGPDDDDEDLALTNSFGEFLRRLDPPPPAAIELAQLSFGLRSVDSELAALVADSDLDLAAIAVRDGGPAGGPRLLTFEVGTGPEADRPEAEPEADVTDSGAPAAIEIEVTGSGQHRRVLGQLHPPGPATIELRRTADPAPRRAEADDRGRFLIDLVGPGPVSITWHRPGQRPVSTAWTSLD